MVWLKKEFNKFEIKFFISELVMLFISTLTYKLFYININKNIASIISILFSLVCNYFMCLKYVFCEEEKKIFSLKKFAEFMLVGIFILLLKKILIDKIYRLLMFPLIVSKLLGFLLTCFFDYYFKQSIFIKNYHISFEKVKNLYSTILKKWNQFIEFRYVHFIFNFLPQNLFLFLFFLGSLYYMGTFFKSNDDLSVYNQVVSDGSISLINESKTIDFSRYQVNQDVDRACLVFETYNRKNTSKLEVKLFKNDKEVYKKNINTANLVNASGYCFDIPLIKKENLKNYQLQVISINATKDNSVSLFSNKKTGEPTFYLKKVHNFCSFKYIMLLILFVIFLGINYVINRTKKMKEITFLLISLFYFGTFLILNPPFEAPDEPIHFYSAYNLAQNGFAGFKTNKISVSKNIECLGYAGVQSLDRVTNFDEVKSCMVGEKNKTVTSIFGVSNRVSSSFLGHVSQALFIKIVTLFTNSPLVIFYFGRLGNFIVSFLILYFAIKICPRYKNIILFIGLTPMFVQQITSLSYDAIVNSISLLFIAYVLELITSKKVISFSSLLIPILFLTIILTVKFVYLPLIVLLFFIPKNKFKNKLQRICYYASIFIVPGLIYYVVNNILYHGDSTLVSTVSGKNLEYILNHPLQLFPIAVKTLKVNGWFYLKSIVGFFDWFRYSLSDFSVFAWYICMFYLIFGHDGILKNKKVVQYLIFCFGILISIAGIFASMYFSWSAYKLSYVDGVQGRYFIPLIMPFMLIMMPKVKKFNLNDSFIYCFCNMMLFQTLFYLITYFY